MNKCCFPDPLEESLKMAEKVRELYLDLLKGLICMDQLREQYDERTQELDSGPLESSTDKEILRVAATESEDEETGSRASEEEQIRTVMQEIEKIKLERAREEKELDEVNSLLVKDVMECEELKKQLEVVENPGNYVWLKKLNEELDDISTLLEMFKSDFNKCQANELPVLEHELQQLREAQNKFVEALEKEECSLLAQLKDLQEKEVMLKSDIVAEIAKEEIVKARMEEMKKQITFNLGQKEFKKLVEANSQRREWKCLHHVRKLNQTAEQLCKNLDKINLEIEIPATTF